MMRLWKPLLPENIANPYPMYAVLRESNPVHKAQTGEWVITKYEDIKAILQDKRFLSGSKKTWVQKGITYFKNKDQDLSQIGKAIDTFLLFINPPGHTKIRKLVSLAWSDKAVDHIIKSNLKTLLSQKSGRIDIINELAQPLPALTISTIMGIPLVDAELLRAKGASLLKVLDLYISLKELVQVDKSASFFVDYFAKHITRKRKHPADDLTSSIIRQNNALHEPASVNELISLCIFLFLAGEETTVSLIGNGLLNLDSWPKQKDLIARNPREWPSAINELLRYDSPVHVVGRVAGTDISFKNVEFQKGDVITLCIASGNRDSARFIHPNVLNIHRKNNRHLAFGSGAHFCMGDWLAKRQGELALRAFLEKYPQYTLEKKDLTWNNNLSIRSLQSLHAKI
ncbi:MAG: cytochrome P450 [Bacteroidota bacterium]